VCNQRNAVTVPLPPWIHPEKEVRSVSLDACIVKPITTLWAARVNTLGCCCGHFEEGPSVIVDGSLESLDLMRIADILRRCDRSRKWAILQWRLTQIDITAARLLDQLGHALSSITSPMRVSPEVEKAWAVFWKLEKNLHAPLAQRI
jgi:hypothetical protein